MRKLLTLAKILLSLLLMGALVWVGIGCAVLWMEGRVLEPQKADCIIILGARINADSQPSVSLLRRLEKALACYEQGLADVMIPCGGQGADEPETEAAAMGKWLVAHGVPEECILLEDTSTSTEENLINAKVLMEENGLSTCIVTTNAYHLTRAMWIANDVGLDAQGAAAMNNITVSTRVRLRMREAVSWVFYFLGI